MADHLLGKTIGGKYRLTALLGRGGMGEVYKVQHLDLDTVLALKILHPHLMESRQMIDRFYREAKIMAKLGPRNPNIVRVVDIDRDKHFDAYYFVMEYIHGETLKQYLNKKGRLDLSEVIEIACQVAGVLASAHTHKPPIIHRDIKPANIMIEEQSRRVVVMDFGIAKEIGGSEGTQPGFLLGTLKYCSPEQIRHESLDGSADIYSLGMVMYEAYTGRQFFAGLDEEAILTKVLAEPQEYEPRFDRLTPRAFSDVITKAIAKSRTLRYRTVADFLKDVDAYQAQLAKPEDETVSLATPDSGAPRNQEEVEEHYRKGEQYCEGTEVVQDYAQAARWYRQAAERGHAEAQTSLGFLYEQGWGVIQDDAEAVQCYRQAAALGEPYGQANLGVMYENGKGVARDYAEAVKWYREAAAQGHARAQYSMGVAYEYGRGVGQDPDEAMKCYRQAAELGDVDAQRKVQERGRSFSSSPLCKDKSEATP